MSAKKIHFILLVSLLAFATIAVCKRERDDDEGKEGDDKDERLFRNFYKRSCPQAEDIVRSITWKKTQSNPALGAKLLRVHYHDCFVRGCDASILLDATGTNQTEKTAGPNLSLSGFEVIDEIKAELEKVCPETVSCADILALAARDAVSFPFQRPMWNVFTGRKDGHASLATEVNGNLPSPNSNFTSLQESFRKKGLNVIDLVALSGAHTIGVAHCRSFSRRLYNFTGQGDTDPSLDPTYAELLKKQCPNPASPAITVEMDSQSSLSFDSNYFDILTKNKGLFTSDAALLTNFISARVVRKFQNQDAFLSSFARSMKNMGRIGVLTGNDGEIRRQCRAVNS